MFTLILLVVVVVIAWFWFTDRRNTQTAIKTSIGTVAKTVSSSFKAVKAEAEIAKTHNEVANIETDRLDRFADRNAERIVNDFMEDMGLGQEFRASQATRLAEAQARLAEAKTKNSRTGK